MLCHVYRETISRGPRTLVRRMYFPNKKMSIRAAPPSRMEIHMMEIYNKKGDIYMGNHVLW